MLTPTVHLVHGFNVRDKGAGTTDKLRPYFEALRYRVKEHDFGFRFLLGVRFGNGKRAQTLSQSIRPGDILVGHSDGCNLITQALKIRDCQSGYDERFRCIFFNPALNRNATQARTVERVLVFHTYTDRIVWLSRCLLFHPWGQMGRLGYRGSQSWIYLNVGYESIGLFGLKHSGVFKYPRRLDTVFERIRKFV